MANTNTWFERLVSGVDAWASRETAIVYGSAEQSLTATYNITLPVYQSSVGFVYAIDATTGIVSGSVMFPYASVQKDVSDLYNIYYGAPTADQALVYSIKDAAENTTDARWRLLTSAELSYSGTYNLGGYVELDLVLEYAMVSATEQDLTCSYDAIAAVTNDLSATYTIVTSPNTAAENVVATYNVVQAVEREIYLVYRIRGGAERDLSPVFNVYYGAYLDIAPEYNINSSAQEPLVCAYTIASKGTAEATRTVTYNIVSITKRVPNVQGYTLPKATNVITQEGLEVGTVTYE